MKEECSKERGLKPIKIFITGPPASGKSHFAKQLAEHYNVPHIHAVKLLQEIAEWDKEKESNWLRRIVLKRKLEEEAGKQQEE